MSVLSTLLDSGLGFVEGASRKRSILLANQISLALFALLMILTGLYAYWYGWYFIARVLPFLALLCLVPVALNRYRFTTASRVWLSLFLSATSLVVSIYSKIQFYSSIHELDYFSFRFFLIAGCTMPPILFTFQEKKALISTSLITFFALMAYDPLHGLFGVPYPDLLLKKESYDFSNVIVGVAYFTIVGAIFFLKSISERNELRANNLILELNQLNRQLAEKNTEIEAQSSELYAQSEVLQENQSKLESANQLIEQQRNRLARQNMDLTLELVEKNRSLTDTNHELIKHNNELSQFSYTVSHNMRGPVASLMGLIQLMDHPDFSTQQGQVRSHLETSVKKLDTIIRDLSKIIDIRHDIFRIRQKVLLTSEMDSIQQMFRNDIASLDARLVVDFSKAPVFYSVRPMLVSILYNLVSNALKYRALDRQLVIEVTSEVVDQHFILTVRDNGLGIDLNRHGVNLFKMYKRFHHHTEGKGLGLYLIKMQAEALNGRIEVQSQVNIFTEFKVYVGIPQNIDEQILIDEPYAKIFFDATLNSTGVIWKCAPTSEQFRHTYMKGLEFLRAYDTPNWITDLTLRGPITPEDLQWMLTEVFPQAVRNGLLRIASVRAQEINTSVEGSATESDKTISASGITMKYFPTFDIARQWIHDENEKAINLKTA